MTGLNLTKIVKEITESGPPLVPLVTPQGTINFNYIPALATILRTESSPKPQDFENLLKNTIPDAEEIVEGIYQSNVAKDYQNPVFQLFRQLYSAVYQGKQQVQNLQNVPNAKNVRPKEIYTKALSDIELLAGGMLAYIKKQYPKQKTVKQDDNSDSQTPVNKPLILQIKDFKNLSQYICNTSEGSECGRVTDKTFEAFLDANNPEAEKFYNLIIQGDDSYELDNINSDCEIIYNLFSELRKECNETVISYSELHSNMSKLNNYYGLGDYKGETNKRNKEFFTTKSLNINTIKRDDLVKFSYQLFDANDKPYLGLNTVYTTTFTYYPAQQKYKFIDYDNHNVIVLFILPLPNPINIFQKYAINYTSRIGDVKYMKIYLTDIKTQKADITHEFIDCAAVEELKELVRNIRGHKR